MLSFAKSFIDDSDAKCIFYSCPPFLTKNDMAENMVKLLLKMVLAKLFVPFPV